jgi:hypothetical protein
VPYNPHGYTTGTMYADTSLSINVAERFSDHLAGYAPVLGVKTASDILASAWVMFNTIRENTQRGGYLKITVPQSLTGKSTNVLQ